MEAENTVENNESDIHLRRTSSFPFRKKPKNAPDKRSVTLKHSKSFSITEDFILESSSTFDCFVDEKKERLNITIVDQRNACAVAASRTYLVERAKNGPRMVGRKRCYAPSKDRSSEEQMPVRKDSIHTVEQADVKDTVLCEGSQEPCLEVCSLEQTGVETSKEAEFCQLECVEAAGRSPPEESGKHDVVNQGNDTAEMKPALNKCSSSSTSLNDSNVNIEIRPRSPASETMRSLGNERNLFEDVITYDSSSINSFADSLMSDSHQTETCIICFMFFNRDSDEMILCNNCSYYICKSCMLCHLKAKITDGFIVIRCPSDSCTRVISDEEVNIYCKEHVALFMKNKVDAENNPKLRTCPGCNIIHDFTQHAEIPSKNKCSSCGLQWCVKCHAPWHTGMSCSKYQKDVVGKGKKALKIWAKCKGKTYANARKCPACKFFIERTSGCDHMCCTRCGTDFCYRCGKKHRKAWLLGDHYSRYYFFGCKYNLAENKPALRVALRTGVLVGSVLALPFAACLLASAGAILVAVSPILAPIALYKMAKKR